MLTVIKYLLEHYFLGLAVVCWTTDHYHPCSKLGMGLTEDCFIFDFASSPSEVTEPI